MKHAVLNFGVRRSAVNKLSFSKNTLMAFILYYRLAWIKDMVLPKKIFPIPTLAKSNNFTLYLPQVWRLKTSRPRQTIKTCLFPISSAASCSVFPPGISNVRIWKRMQRTISDKMKALKKAFRTVQYSSESSYNSREKSHCSREAICTYGQT